MTKDLYTAKDVSEVKRLLYAEQDGKCALSGVAVQLKDCHTDHSHDDEQFVRGVLYKQSNMGLGKIEGLWTRYLKYWYPDDLPTFLRQAADYLERSKDTRYRHPGWTKRLQTIFNGLKEPVKDDILKSLVVGSGNNAKTRKELFRKAVLSRKFNYNELKDLILKEMK